MPIERSRETEPQGNEKMAVGSGRPGIRACGCRPSLLPSRIHCTASFGPQGSAMKQASSPRAHRPLN